MSDTPRHGLDRAASERWVDYEQGSRWRDLWVLRFAADGRVMALEEWPFAPEQRDGHVAERAGLPDDPAAVRALRTNENVF